MSDTAREVGVVTNAIAYALYCEDGRDIQMVNGVESIETTDEEAVLCRKAAFRAIQELDRYRISRAQEERTKRAAAAKTLLGVDDEITQDIAIVGEGWQ